MSERDKQLLATMVYEAVRFSSWAVGEGITPVAGEPAKDPGEFLSDYVTGIDGDDYEGLAEVARDAIAGAPQGMQPELLEPFVTFAKDNVDFDGQTYGWTSNIHREQISDWFGPSEFGKLAAAAARVADSSGSEAGASGASKGTEASIGCAPGVSVPTPSTRSAATSKQVPAFGMMKANGDLLPCAVAEEDAIYHMCAPMFDVSAEYVRTKLEAAGWHTVRVQISMDPTEPLARNDRGSPAT